MTLWKHGVRYGDAGGHLTVVGGSMRVTVVVAERDGAKQSFALPVPRRLEFDIKLLVIDGCPAQLVIGWATLLRHWAHVVFGAEQYEPGSERAWISGTICGRT